LEKGDQEKVKAPTKTKFRGIEAIPGRKTEWLSHLILRRGGGRRPGTRNKRKKKTPNWGRKNT